MDQNIKFNVSADGVQAETTLAMLKDQFTKIKTEMDKLPIAGQRFASVNKDYTEMGKLINNVTNQTSKLELEKVKLAQIQEQEMAALQAHLGRMEQRGAIEGELDARKYTAIKKNIVAMEEYSAKIMQAGLAAGKMDAGLASRMNVSRMSVMNFNRVVQDAPYFMNSFAMGVMAIGNNLDPLAQTLARSKELTGSWKLALKDLVAGFTGTSGLLSVISLAVSAFTAYSLASRDSKDATEDWDLESLSSTLDDFTKALERNREELEKLSGVDLSNTLEGLRENLRKTSTEFLDLASKMTGYSVANALLGVDLGKMLGSDTDFDKLTKKIIAMMNAIKVGEDTQAKPGIIGKLKAEIQELSDSLDSAKTQTEIDKITASIKRLNAELDRRQGKTVKGKLEVSEEGMWMKDAWDALEEFDKEFGKMINKNFVEAAEGMIELEKLNLANINEGFKDWDKDFLQMFDALEKLSFEMKEKLNDPKYQRELKPFASDFADSFGDALANSGVDAFEKMFGEANSMLEMFVASFYSSLAGRTGNALSDTMFGLISGNPVNFLDALFGKQSAVGGGTSTQEIHFYVDSELMAKKTVTGKNVNKAMKEIVNLRIN